MMERMSRDEFVDWMVLAEIEPFGEAREDLRAGLMWSAFVSANSDHKKYPKGISLDKYPLLAMQTNMNRPKVTSQSLFKALKALSRKKPS